MLIYFSSSSPHTLYAVIEYNRSSAYAYAYTCFSVCLSQCTSFLSSFACSFRWLGKVCLLGKSIGIPLYVISNMNYNMVSKLCFKSYNMVSFDRRDSGVRNGLLNILSHKQFAEVASRFLLLSLLPCLIFSFVTDGHCPRLLEAAQTLFWNGNSLTRGWDCKIAEEDFT